MMDEKQSPLCPECDNPIFFSPDGRQRVCERCGHREAVEGRKQKSVIELEKALDFMGIGPGRRAAHGPAKTTRRNRARRDLLIRGIAAAKANQTDDAFYYLASVLKATDSADKERASAWLWLSALCEQPDEKRLCLKNVLAIDPANPEARRGMAILDGRLKQDEIIDPDKIALPDSNVHEAARGEQIRCPRCSARMRYSPEVGALRCNFCHFSQPLGAGSPSGVREDIEEYEQEFVTALATARGHQRPAAMRAMQCHSCAVDFLLAPEALSLTCPYCDSVYVVESVGTTEVMPPQAIIPFATTHEDALRALKRWAEEHNIVGPRLSPLVGAYLPVWTFDIGGPVKWSCLVRQGDGWESRTGEHYALYDDVLIPASGRLPSEMWPHLEEFDLNDLVPYDGRYLADWPAERYQLSLADASLQARAKVMKELRKRPSNRYVHEDHSDFKLLASGGLSVTSYKLILLPIWLVHYALEGRSYHVLVNGQTLVVRGNRPQGFAGKVWSWLTGS
jgi:DNA-directed RNA polymerase subunit RPC12/RpoP